MDWCKEKHENDLNYSLFMCCAVVASQKKELNAYFPVNVSNFSLILLLFRSVTKIVKHIAYMRKRM